MSNEDIKEGDWYYIPRTNSIYQCQDDPTELSLERHVGVRKIIATTDKSLKINKGLIDKIVGLNRIVSEDKIVFQKQLPQPSQFFIEYFVSEYNKGNVITEVMVEYGDAVIYNHSNNMNEVHLKINSKDNTINIKEIKNSWTKDEHVADIKRMIELYATTYIQGDIDKWIEDNL